MTPGSRAYIFSLVLLIGLVPSHAATASAHEKTAEQDSSPAFTIEDEPFSVAAEYARASLGNGKMIGVFVPHFAAFYNLKNNPNFQESIDGTFQLKEGANPRMIVVLPPKGAYFSDTYHYARDLPQWILSVADPKINGKINQILIDESLKYETIFGKEIQEKDIKYLELRKDFGRLYHDRINLRSDSSAGRHNPTRSGYKYCQNFEEKIQGYDLVVAPYVCIVDKHAIIEENSLYPREEWPVDRYISRKKLYQQAVNELQQEAEDYQQALESAPETPSLLVIQNFRSPQKERWRDGSPNRGAICSVSGVDELNLDVVNLIESKGQEKTYPITVFDDIDKLYGDIQERGKSCRFIVLPLKQKEILKEALNRKNISYLLPYQFYRFNKPFDLLKDYYSVLEIESREEYGFYKALGFDKRTIAAFKSEGITTFAKHAEFKRRHEGEFSSTDLGTIEGVLYAISVKQKAETNNQSIAAYLQTEQEAEAAQREEQRAAAAKRAERHRASEKKKAKDFPYYAEVSCELPGTTVDIRACFSETTLTLSMNGRTWEKKSWQLGDVGSMRGDVLIIDLPEQFSIKAQNSHETLGITIEIKDRLTSRIIASDQANSLYRVAWIRR